MLKRKKKLKAVQVNLLCRQLAMMTASGMPLDGAVRVLAEEGDEAPLFEMLDTMRKELDRGASLGSVITGHVPQAHGLAPAVFEQDARAVSRVFTDLAEFGEKRDSLRRLMILSFLYPAIVGSVLLVVCLLLMTVAVPMLAEMFTGSGSMLPLPTRIILAVSRLVSAYWFLLPAGILAMILIVRYRMPWVLALADKVPGMNLLNRKIAAAEFLQNFALMANADIAPGEALRAAAGSVSNAFYAEKLREAAASAADTAQFLGSVRGAGIIPPMVSHSVRAGERSGTLTGALQETSRFMAQDAENTYERFLALLYPVTIGILGALVGFIIIALYMPIFQMGSVL